MRISDYSGIPIQESGDPMVDLAPFPFVLEPAQFRKGYTANPQLWARKTLALKLEDIQRSVLEPQNLRFKIFDAWRPRDVQNKVYAACWNALSQQYPEMTPERVDEVAARHVINGYDDALVPPHTTGGAVDLTLVHGDSGEELPMGIPYCGWMETGDAGLNDAAIANRRLLVIAMQGQGFVQDPDQWWHFDYGNQKWAKITGGAIAIYGEVDGGMGFMKKSSGYGHGMKLPFEAR